MHIEFLVEEESAERALEVLIPKILGQGLTFALHPFQGKPDLLQKLPSRLKGYRPWLPADWRIVVLIDNDREDCRALKRTLEQGARNAGFRTKSMVAHDASFEVLNRLAIEELEAWFFGDVTALVSAYPGVSPHLASQARYRDPDAIPGGTWEALERVLQSKGYYPAGMPKVETARRIAQQMVPDRNRSRSFCKFREGLREAVR